MDSKSDNEKLQSQNPTNILFLTLTPIFLSWQHSYAENRHRRKTVDRTSWYDLSHESAI